MKQLIKQAIHLTTLGFETGATVDRYWMYERIKSGLAALDTPTYRTRILSVSYSLYLADLVGGEDREIVEANYPEYDIFDLPFDDNSFDFVVADQVLEHVAGNPQIAVNETRRVLRPGGIAIHTTCLINEVHDHPGDYWRFTPYGLRLLCKDFSDVIQCEGWGNKIAYFGFRYFKTPISKKHPINWIATRNNPEAPISTWFLVRK